MKRLVFLIPTRIARAISLFLVIGLFTFSLSSSLVKADDLQDLPMPLFSGWGMWDITRACADNCNSPRDTIGKKICCIETMVEQILQITCNTQSIIENIQAKVEALESCQEEMCLQNAVDASLVENIQILGNEINTKVCEVETLTETIDTDATSVYEDVINFFNTKETIFDITCTILDQVTQNLSAIDPIQTLANSALDKLSMALTIENTVAHTLSITDAELKAVLSLSDSIVSKSMIVESQLDTLLSRADVIESKIDALFPCNAQPIFQPTLISSAGTYCLANDIAGQVTIGADNVTLYMNGHRVYSGTNGIEIQANKINTVIYGPGSVGPVTNAGILANGGVQLLTVSNVQATQASTAGFFANGTSASPAINIKLINCSADSCPLGIYMNNTNAGQVTGCEMVSNTTGVLLQNTSQIVVDGTVASTNTVCGFSLAYSSTNIFTECKALNNGSGSTGNSFGFISTNGLGNIFENCLADGTSTSISSINATVAGFAFTGSEMCSKIFGCESVNNNVTQVSSFSYGILLQNYFNNLVPPTSSPNYGNTIRSVSWSADENYVAVAGSSGILKIYQFNPVDNSLTELPTSANIGSVLGAVAWSPNNRFIAIGSAITGTVYIYSFDSISQTLILVATKTSSGAGTGIKTIDWSPNNNYVSVGRDNNQIDTYAFNTSSHNLALIDTQTYGGGSVLSIDWSTNGQFLAAGGSGGSIKIYQFNTYTRSFSLVNGSQVYNGGNNINALSWSPVCNYLAVGGVGGPISVYQFNPATFTLTSVGVTQLYNNSINTLMWSANGQYLAVGGNPPEKVKIYEFNFITQTLTLKDNSQNYDGSNIPLSLQWSPDGQFLAVGGDSGLVVTFHALRFPSSNIVKDSIAYCNDGGSSTCLTGIGLSGSSVANAIINNTSYNNNGYNYQFVTNVFDQQFYAVPSELQNIAIKGCEAIVNPQNINQELNCDLASVQNLSITDAALATDQSIIDNIFGRLHSVSDLILVDQTLIIAGLPIGRCNPTAITSTTSFSITSPGVYCLNSNVTGGITISSSNVTLDLNSHQVVNASGSAITVNSGLSKINIMNGRVEGTNNNGIVVNSGVSQLNLLDVTARNSTRGAQLNSVNYGTISHCDFSFNTTGIELNTCTNISLNTCQAASNNVTGFSLITSGTNTITNCKAIDNGITSTGNSYGFISTNGFCNIFSNCIANGTRTTSANVNLVVAGFALTGSESCSQIVDCESGNNTSAYSTSVVSTSTLTFAATPHGILLQSTMPINSSSTPAVTVTTPNVVDAIAWSPCGNYLVASQASTFNLLLYKRDKTNPNVLTLIQTLSTGSSPYHIFELAWSPDGTTLATNDGIGIVRLYQLNTTLPTPLKFIFSINTSNFTSPFGLTSTLAWSPDGNYLAMGGIGITAAKVYQFNRSKQYLTLVTSVPIITSFANVSWSPDNKYFCVGTNSNLRIYNQAFSLIATIVGDFTSLAWSPTGNYLAAGTLLNNLNIYKRDDNNPAIVTLISSLATGFVNGVETLAWSPDGNYITCGTEDNMSSPSAFVIFQRNLNNSTLFTNIATVTTTLDPLATIVFSWSPDGVYLCASTGYEFGGDNKILIYNAFQFPTKNIVKKNTVYCNTAGNTAQSWGMGINGSSINNLIISNLSYNNPLNYAFIPNVFSQLVYGTNIPSPLQNIALASNVPITKPINTYQETGILEQEALTLNSIIDRILARLP